MNPQFPPTILLNWVGNLGGFIGQYAMGAINNRKLPFILRKHSPTRFFTIAEDMTVVSHSRLAKNPRFQELGFLKNLTQIFLDPLAVDFRSY